MEFIHRGIENFHAWTWNLQKVPEYWGNNAQNRVQITAKAHKMLLKPLFIRWQMFLNYIGCENDYWLLFPHVIKIWYDFPFV